jgi:hypothetical protein
MLLVSGYKLPKYELSMEEVLARDRPNGTEDNGRGWQYLHIVLSLHRGREWTQFTQSP